MTLFRVAGDRSALIPDPPARLTASTTRSAFLLRCEIFPLVEGQSPLLDPVKLRCDKLGRHPPARPLNVYTKIRRCADVYALCAALAYLTLKR